MGIAHRWTEVSQAYADVNRLFGDIVKVTPTSKVVGDMAVMMVANDLTVQDMGDPAHEVAFPESVGSLLRGELGFPPDGFPAALSRKVLRLTDGEAPPAPYRPGDRLAPVDLEAIRKTAEAECEQPLDERQLASWLMYLKVTRDYYEHLKQNGDTAVLPTPVFFYGPQPQQEIAVEIDPGKTLLIALQSVSADGDAAHKRCSSSSTASPAPCASRARMPAKAYRAARWPTPPTPGTWPRRCPAPSSMWP